jgi:hypothetical protein
MDTLIGPAQEIKQSNRKHSTLQTRQVHIRKWKESNLSMSAYCRQQNLSVSSLSKWVQDSHKKSKTLFKPVISTTSLPRAKELASNVIEIFVGQQIKIRFINAADSSFIMNIIKGLAVCN